MNTGAKRKKGGIYGNAIKHSNAAEYNCTGGPLPARDLAKLKDELLEYKSKNSRDATIVELIGKALNLCDKVLEENEKLREDMQKFVHDVLVNVYENDVSNSKTNVLLLSGKNNNSSITQSDSIFG